MKFSQGIGPTNCFAVSLGFSRFMYLVLSCVLVLQLGSQDSFAKKKGPDTFMTTVDVPSLTLEPLKDFPPVREVGGVRMELIPTAFKTRTMALQEVQQRNGFCLYGEVAATIKKTPSYILDPTNVQFSLRVTNHLAKLLRLEGVGLVFELDGKAIAADYTENEIQRALIAPEKSWEGALKGPSVEAFGKDMGPGKDKLKQNGTLKIGIYDVITEVDEASNPKVRSNFEWFYSYDAVNSRQEMAGSVFNDCLPPLQFNSVVGTHLVVPSGADAPAAAKP